MTASVRKIIKLINEFLDTDRVIRNNSYQNSMKNTKMT